MPINPNIALSGKGLEIENPLVNASRLAQLQQSTDASKLSQLAISQKQGEIDSGNALTKALASAGDPTAEGFREKARAAVVAAGQAAKLPELNAQWSQEDESREKAEAAQIDTALKGVGYTAQLLSGATPENYAHVKMAITGINPKAAAALPEVYDKGQIDALVNQSVPVVQQMEMRAKALSESAAARKAEAEAKAAQAEKDRNFQQKEREIDLAHQDRLAAIGAKAAEREAKPMPPSAVKAQSDSLEKITIAGNTEENAKNVIDQIDRGVLDFGPIDNLTNSVRNATNTSNESSRAYGAFKSMVQRLTNDSLRLNNGVQTDGDALREALATLSTTNDTQVIRDSMATVMRINEQAKQLHMRQVDTLRSEYGNGPMDFSGYAGKKTALPGQITIPGAHVGGQTIGAPVGSKNDRGWVLHVDAKGNRAYVSPDGKQYEEAL